MSADLFASEQVAQFARSLSIPTVVAHAIREATAQWPHALPANAVKRARRLVISGCGDSLFAGMACRHAIERFSGLPCEALDALECGRYAAARFGPDVAVLAVSNSGTTSRVIESLGLARRAGAMSLALTGAPGSPLCEVAQGSIVRSVQGLGGGNHHTGRLERHLGEYLSTLAVLYEWALYLGTVRGVVSEAERRRQVDALGAAAEVAQRAGVESVDAVAHVLAVIGEADRVFYLGAGPSYGTALFGAAKLLEEVPLCGIPQQLEEWAHEQYFLTMVEGTRSCVVVVAPPGDTTDRAAEVLQSIRGQGGVTIAVTSPQEEEILQHAAAAMVVSGACWEGYSPLPYAMPVQVLGLGLAFARGRTVLPLSRQDGGGLIRNSGIREAKRGG